MKTENYYEWKIKETGRKRAIAGFHFPISKSHPKKLLIIPPIEVLLPFKPTRKYLRNYTLEILAGFTVYCECNSARLCTTVYFLKIPH